MFGTKSEEAQSIIDIKNIYDNDSRPFVVGFSNGKDSNTTLDIILKALILSNTNDKTTYIMYSDTKLEMAPFAKSVDDAFDKLKVFGEENNLNLTLMRVEPKKTDTFSSLFFGAGYVLSHSGNRWCTNRWKILPQERAIKGLLQSHEGFIAVTGQRRSESPDRAKRLENCTVEGEILKTHENSKCSLLVPVEYYSSNDIWDYLYTRQQSWVDSTTLGKVYSESAGDTKGECRNLIDGVDGEEPGCGKSARNGCDICPLFKRDKTLINLTEHYDYLHDVEKFRNWLIDLSAESGWRERDIYMHGKNIHNTYNRDNHRKGMTVPGGMSLAFRKKTLEKYLELDEKLFPITGTRRVDDFELTFIQERWIEEGEYELGVFALAPNRTFEISEFHRSILEAVRIYKSKFFKSPSANSIVWHESYWDTVGAPLPTADARFYAQLSISLSKKGICPVSTATAFVGSNQEEYDKAEALILEATEDISDKQYYPSENEEEYARWEWKKDTVGMGTVLDRHEKGELEKPKNTLFGYEGEFGIQFEMIDELNEKGDITICDSIPLEDKMAWFN